MPRQFSTLAARRLCVRPEAMLGQAMSTSKAGSSPPAADSRVRAAARLSAKESDPHFDLVEQSLPDSCGARGAIAHDPIRSCSALLPGALSSGVRSLGRGPEEAGASKPRPALVTRGRERAIF